MHVLVEQAGPATARRGSPGCRRRGARPPCGSREFGATLLRHGTRRETASIAARSKSISPSWAAARMCSTVFVEPPMATSSAIAFSNAVPRWRCARERGRVVVASYQRRRRAMTVPAGLEEQLAARGVRGQRRAVAGQRQPERLGEAVHRVGGEHAGARPAGRAGGALDLGEPGVVRPADDADAEIAVIRSVGACATPSTTTALPASIGPPETKTVGMLSRMAALSMPGVILSQFEMQTSASAACPLTMYSTASAITSRRGQRVEHPAVPHRDAVVDGDRVELPRHPAGLAGSAGDEIAHVLEVHVTGHELGVGVRDRDDGLAEVVVAHAGGAPEGAGSGGVAAVGGDAGTKGRHVGLSSRSGSRPGPLRGVDRTARVDATIPSEVDRRPRYAPVPARGSDDCSTSRGSWPVHGSVGRWPPSG